MEKLKLQDTICFFRNQQGLTQEELAQKLGVTNQTVSKWESAQCCPDISLLPKLAAIFDKSIDELFGITTEKEIHFNGFSERDYKFLSVALKIIKMLPCRKHFYCLFDYLLIALVRMDMSQMFQLALEKNGAAVLYDLINIYDKK